MLSERKEIRLSKKDVELLKANTEKNGFKTESDYIRFLIHNKQAEHPEVKKLLTDLMYELNRIGNNINQITKNYNAAFVTQGEIKELKSDMKSIILKFDILENKLG